LPTTLDCEVLRDLYGSAEVRAVFDSRALVQAWLDVERALAEAEAAVGVIPTPAAERIASEADASLYDLDGLREGVASSQHPLVPLVRALAERCGEHGGHVHWGATTQDIMDTALVMQARAALLPIMRDLERSRAAAAGLARGFRDSPMAGRTHGQHAVPITFGLKTASWADELGRCIARLEAAKQTALTAQLGGAAGTLASLGADARAVRRGYASALDLAEAEIPWHAARDRLRDLAHALDELSAAAERIASEIVRLQATEIAEVSELPSSQHVGSSTMPQKRNPLTSEYVVASARLVRASTSAIAGSPAHASERDMAAWGIEWLALPQALILTGGIAEKLAQLLEGLVADSARMLENMGLTRGRIMAEAAMMALAPALGRERAHEVVGAASERALANGHDFSSVLSEDPVVSAHLTAEQIRGLMEPSRYLGLAGEAVDAVASGKEER
jgi:adenylosuccinate lyase/3-carboxy-cis,cis-muconate cycloisomerase